MLCGMDNGKVQEQVRGTDRRGKGAAADETAQGPVGQAAKRPSARGLKSART
jgi:hypothetical protein